jgi:hypothetical protein
MCHLSITIFLLILAIISFTDSSDAFCVVIVLVLSCDAHVTCHVMHMLPVMWCTHYLFSSLVLGTWLELQTRDKVRHLHSKIVNTWIISSPQSVSLQRVCQYRGVSAHRGCTWQLAMCAPVTHSHILCGVIILYLTSVFILIYVRYTSCCKIGDITEHKKLLLLYIYFLLDIQYVEHFSWKVCCGVWVAHNSVDKNSGLWCDTMWMGI